MDHRRRQFSVGQGFFHAGEVRVDGTNPMTYVYDCGATSRYKSVLNARIAEYASSSLSGKLDYLFISHAHFDHISGVAALLDTAKGGISVDTIVMPFVDVYDRLVAFAQAVAGDAAVANEIFYRDFVVDPVGTLDGFGPRQILIVRKGRGPAGGGPDGPVGPERPEPLDPDKLPRSKLVGRGHHQRR
jgi:glyoxylase-like metal-dependent hydrolase (beta-lactamase superfamily II)